MDIEVLIEKLGLAPHPAEGGYFAETYRSDETVAGSALPARYGRDKALATAIYYLITPETLSAMHRLASDEVFHFYTGDPVQMLQLAPDASHRVIRLGHDIEAGELPQVVVPRLTWQGSRLVPGGRWALMGTTVAPAFDYDDYEQADREKLIAAYPECEEMIRVLTRQ